MSRSPWRDALDGQIKVLRELRRDSAIIHLARTADTLETRNALTNKLQRADFQIEVGRSISEALEKLIREAEPVYLSYDIFQELDRRIEREMAQNELRTPVLTHAMLPIKAGYIDFGLRHLELRDIPNPAEEQGTLSIKGIYFGARYQVEINRSSNLPGRWEIEVRSDDGDRMHGMGIVVFLDARASGFIQMTRDFGDHLVPIPMSNWEFGKTLAEYVEELPTGPGTNVSGMKIIAGCVGYFLQTLFILMLQRITRWGGVGLNREEQKLAEREQVRPRVQLVTWRKANYKYPEGHIPVPKNWSCRWSVTEHYRRYKSGKVVKIKSYVKGPHDKPFRLPAQRVHQVKQ